MFEDSLIESNGQIRTKKGSTVLISTVIHVLLITILVLIPLISYSELPKQQLMTMLIAPPPPPATAAAAGRSCSGATAGYQAGAD